MPAIGQTISHYTITRSIGSGGMGMVFQATDLRLDRTVALKFLPPELSRNQEAKERLIREARAASSIQHKNICVIHDIDEAGDALLFICMEFLQGQTLKSRIEAGTLRVDEALNVALQIAEGLAKAHQAGIVHRDLKPANVIITQENVVKILDFGLAEVGDSLHPTQPGATVGTAAYMSPEQARGEQVDARTDVWSLGVLLYEMLTGRRPFGSEYVQAVLYSLAHEQHRPVREFRPEVPAAVERVINSCLEKERDARPPNAGVLLAELRRAKQSPAGKAGAAVKAVAVLPFSDISPDQDNRYFSDGLTEEIIAKLSRLRTMKVIPRTSVMSYDRAGKPVHQIASELGVRYLIEGGVRKHGQNLRITTRLIDPAQDGYVWAETYDGTMDEVFEIQENVAARIVKALKVRVSPDEKRILKRRATENTEAYQLYLKGRSFWNTRSREGLETAKRYFEMAIEKDPGYALAWTGIADVYNLIFDYTWAPRRESYAKAREAALKALELDDQLAEAHASYGIIVLLNEWDWTTAEREFKLAISLNPNYATAHHWFAELASMQGRLGEAIASISKAAELDPGVPGILKDKGMILYYARDYDGAIDYARITLQADPEFSVAHRLLALAYQAKGMYAEAVAENRRWGDMTGKKSEADVAIAQCHAASGNAPEALAILRRVEAEGEVNGNLFRGIALGYAALGDIAKAFSWLDQSSALVAESLCTLRVDPKVDRLRGDPRFDALLKKVGLAG